MKWLELTAATLLASASLAIVVIALDPIPSHGPLRPARAANRADANGDGNEEANGMQLRERFHPELGHCLEFLGPFEGDPRQVAPIAWDAETAAAARAAAEASAAPVTQPPAQPSDAPKPNGGH